LWHGRPPRCGGFSVLEESYAVPSLLFSDVEGTVAAAQDLEPSGIGGEQSGDAEAGGEANLLALVLDGEAGETVAKIFGDLGGVVVGGAGQDGNELFTAEAGDMVDVAEIVAEAARGVVQGDVTAVVAVFIIDGFEAVEVEDDERECGVVTACTLDGCGADLLEGTAVEQTGERVGLGLGFEFKLELRHGEPDNAESGHDGDEDRSDEGESAGTGRRQQAARIVKVSLPCAIDINLRVESEEDGKTKPRHVDALRSGTA
jgi:hypothetical protein